jgi:hypothetical protein
MGFDVETFRSMVDGVRDVRLEPLEEPPIQLSRFTPLEDVKKALCRTVAG